MRVGVGVARFRLCFDGPGSNAESGQPNAHSTQAGGGMPSHSPIQIHIRVALYMWFCDHCEWWGVWFWLLPLEHGLTFGVGRDFHIRVCMSNSCEPKNDSSSPHGSLLEQVAVAKFF